MAECAERRECAGASWRPLSAAASNATDPRRLPLVQSPLTATDLTRDGLTCVLWRAMGPKGCALQPVAGDPRERAQTRKPNAAPDPWRHWRRSQGDGDGDSQAAQPSIEGAGPVLLVGVGPAKSGSTLLFERVAASAGVRAAASGHGRLAPGAERHSGALRMPAGATACCGMETYFWADPCVASRGDSAAVYRLLHFDFEAPPQQPQPQPQATWLLAEKTPRYADHPMAPWMLHGAMLGGGGGGGGIAGGARVRAVRAVVTMRRPEEALASLFDYHRVRGKAGLEFDEWVAMQLRAEERLTHCIQRVYGSLGLTQHAARPHGAASLLSGGTRYPHLQPQPQPQPQPQQQKPSPRRSSQWSAEAIDEALHDRCWRPMAYDRCWGTQRNGVTPRAVGGGECVEEHVSHYLYADIVARWQAAVGAPNVLCVFPSADMAATARAVLRFAADGEVVQPGVAAAEGSQTKATATSAGCREHAKEHGLRVASVCRQGGPRKRTFNLGTTNSATLRLLQQLYARYEPRLERACAGHSIGTPWWGE